MARALSAPHRQWLVGMEPRVDSDGAMTAWDFFTKPPEALIEAKLSPTREDILEWLRRVEKGAVKSTERQFRLVYSDGGGALMSCLRALLRIAAEADGDTTKFENLCSSERLNHPTIFQALGSSPYNLLRRITLVCSPQHQLETNIEFRARLLAGEEDGRRLIDMLSRIFSKAITERAQYAVTELITEARSRRVELRSPPVVDSADLPHDLADALLILQACDEGLPAEVVAGAVGCSESKLHSDLGELLTTNVISEENGLTRLLPLPSKLTGNSDTDELLSRALESMLRYLESRPHIHGASIDRQLRSALALADKCVGSYPRPVARLFMRLDKLLKSSGNKRLVLRAAQLSINAARRPRRTKLEVEGETQALICGKSWVFQRIGRLPEARSEAQKSLKLGEEIGWDRNTAYCKKCLGRLHRMEAEAEHDNSRRRDLLSKSEAYLTEAIEMFKRMGEFGSNHPEVGDCYSLLGRTYLVAARKREAEAAIYEATRLITDEGSKDYMDLTILRGDLLAAKRDWTGARSAYEEALRHSRSDDNEITEMRARAFLQLGRSLEALREAERAASCFKKAADIWQSLEEFTSTAGARWETIRLGKIFTDDVERRLLRESPSVRVRVAELHAQRSAGLSKSVAKRAKPASKYWQQLIKEATEYVAVEDVEW